TRLAQATGADAARPARARSIADAVATAGTGTQRAGKGNHRARGAVGRCRVAADAARRWSVHGARTGSARGRHQPLSTAAEPGELLGTHAVLPQLGREESAAGFDQQ